MVDNDSVPFALKPMRSAVLLCVMFFFFHERNSTIVSYSIDIQVRTRQQLCCPWVHVGVAT